MIYETIGYIGLLLNLYSMYTKGEYKLRLYSAIANSVYIVYGMMINAYPIVIGCTIAVILHTLRLKKLNKVHYAGNKESDNQ